MFTSYFLNKEKAVEINELSAFLMKNEKPNNEKEFFSFKERLIKFLSSDYNWLCAEYENTSKVIEENNKAISNDQDRKNEELYSESYNLYHFHKYYLLAPFNLLNLAHKYKFGFGKEFVEFIDNYKSKNKEILELTQPNFKFNV